ncbi:MAG TPA: hypothetical protein VFP13_10655 [Actinomycetota bacterium]|nr:hypothetical protein [Actinomycetota bacterium]
MPAADSSAPLWPWILLALVVIGVVATYVIRSRSLEAGGTHAADADAPTAPLEGPTSPPERPGGTPDDPTQPPS